MPCMTLTPYPEKLPPIWTRDFTILFLLAMFSNSAIAVFYCFEQWLVTLHIAAHWRGGLLSAMFFMIMLGRPLISVWVIRHSVLPILATGILGNSACMFAYSYLDSPLTILLIRMIQGLALATISSAVTSVLVNCIPKGNSARGFALFSLTVLLPYSTIPLLSEQLLPLVGGEAQLFACVGFMGIPALGMLFLLARGSAVYENQKQHPPKTSTLLHTLRHSGLGFFFAACTFFGSMTILVICFVKGLAQFKHTDSSLFFCAYTFLVIMTRLLGGNYMDTLPRRKVLLLFGLGLVSSLLGLALGPSWTFLPLACLYGLGLGLYYPLLAASIYDGSTPENRSLNSNMMMLTFDTSAAIAPLFGGMVLSAGGGYPGVFLLAAGVIGLSLCCVLLAPYPQRQKP